MHRWRDRSSEPLDTLIGRFAVREVPCSPQTELPYGLMESLSDNEMAVRDEAIIDDDSMKGLESAPSVLLGRFQVSDLEDSDHQSKCEDTLLECGEPAIPPSVKCIDTTDLLTVLNSRFEALLEENRRLRDENSRLRDLVQRSSQ